MGKKDLYLVYHTYHTPFSLLLFEWMLDIAHFNCRVPYFVTFFQIVSYFVLMSKLFGISWILSKLAFKLLDGSRTAFDPGLI